MSSYRFKEHSSFNVVGSTNTGKSRWVYKLLLNKDQMFEGPPITKILYCYSVYQDLFDEMGSALPLIQFKQGLPSKDELDSLSADKQPSLLILDDLMELVGSSRNMSAYFVSIHTTRISMLSTFLRTYSNKGNTPGP